MNLRSSKEDTDQSDKDTESDKAPNKANKKSEVKKPTSTKPPAKKSVTKKPPAKKPPTKKPPTKKPSTKKPPKPKKNAVEPGIINQKLLDIARLEHNNAAAYADNTTPGASLPSKDTKKGHVVATPKQSRGRAHNNVSDASDAELDELTETDVEGTVKGKGSSRGNRGFRNALTGIRKTLDLPPVNENEEDPTIDFEEHHSQPMDKAGDDAGDKDQSQGEAGDDAGDKDQSQDEVRESVEEVREVEALENRSAIRDGKRKAQRIESPDCSGDYEMHGRSPTPYPERSLKANGAFEMLILRLQTRGEH